MESSMQSRRRVTPMAGAASVALGLAAAFAAAAYSPAHADAPGKDWKGYAGVNCMPDDGTASFKRSSLTKPAFANSGTSTLTVYCPVVRDVSEGAPARVAAVAVHYNNRNSAVAGRCDFSSHDINGNKVDSKSAPMPSGEGTLVLGPLDANNWGTYVLTCQLPGRDATTNLQSFLISYRVDEKL